MMSCWIFLRFLDRLGPSNGINQHEDVAHQAFEGPNRLQAGLPPPPVCQQTMDGLPTRSPTIDP